MKLIDRNGKILDQDSRQDKLLRRLYTHRAGRIFLKLLIQPAISERVGSLLNTKISACLIKPFVKKNHIDMTDYQEEHYDSYNAFFVRRIKRGARVIQREGSVLISPCDGKLSVYEIHSNSQFEIKDTSYSIEELTHSKRISEYFQGGYACIFRLTVDDYHHFCYMDNGIRSDSFRIPGVLHTVNPVANKYYPIYKRNTREYCLLKSEHFGTMMIMEVGALMVGKIVNYHQRGRVEKGQEKGHFEFGGSTIVVLISKNKVYIDSDLIENSKNGFETIIKMGEQIGIQENKKY